MKSRRRSPAGEKIRTKTNKDLTTIKQYCGSGSAFNMATRSGSGFGIRIRIQRLKCLLSRFLREIYFRAISLFKKYKLYSFVEIFRSSAEFNNFIFEKDSYFIKLNEKIISFCVTTTQYDVEHIVYDISFQKNSSHKEHGSGSTTLRLSTTIDN
jgi:hypothetical protein